MDAIDSIVAVGGSCICVCVLHVLYEWGCARETVYVHVMAGHDTPIYTHVRGHGGMVTRIVTTHAYAVPQHSMHVPTHFADTTSRACTAVMLPVVFAAPSETLRLAIHTRTMSGVLTTHHVSGACSVAPGMYVEQELRVGFTRRHVDNSIVCNGCGEVFGAAGHEFWVHLLPTSMQRSGVIDTAVLNAACRELSLVINDE